MDKDLSKKREEIEPIGVMAYTSLMSILARCQDDVDSRTGAILHKLPTALLAALQNEECLQDIKNVGEKYPDLLPIIFAYAFGLRNNKKLNEWMKYESVNYREYIDNIGNAHKEWRNYLNKDTKSGR